MAIATGPAKPGVAPTAIPKRNPANTIATVMEIDIPNNVSTAGPEKTASTPNSM
jgi:hypothetical protein